MKKILSLLLLLMLIVSAAACSSPSNKESSKETLKTENNTEIEKEKTAKQSDNETKTETDPSPVPMSFEEVYKGNKEGFSGKDLLPVIDYFYNNHDSFEAAARDEFAKKIFKVIDMDKMKLQMVEEVFVSKGDYMGTPEAKYTNSMYDYYNLDTNEFNINYFDGNIKSEIMSILDGSIYKLAKKYFATEGYVEDSGFCITISPEIFEKLKPAVSIVYPDKYREEDYFEMQPICPPNMIFKSIDDVLSTNITYPMVYIINPKDVFKFENGKIWKTTVILPVNIVEGEPNAGGSLDKPLDGEVKEGKITGLNLHELKNGDSVSNLVIQDINYKKGSDSASFRLIGSTMVIGEIYLDQDFIGAYVLSVTDPYEFDTVINVEFPDNYIVNYRPSYLAFSNEDKLLSLFTKEEIAKFKNGGKLGVKIYIKDIGVAMKYESEGGESCEFVKIVDSWWE